MIGWNISGAPSQASVSFMFFNKQRLGFEYEIEVNILGQLSLYDI